MASLTQAVSTTVRVDTTPAPRTYAFGFDVLPGSRLVVTVDGVDLSDTLWRQEGRTVVIDGSVTLRGGSTTQAGSTITIARDTPIRRLTDFGTEAYARGPAVEVGFDRLVALVEEIAAELDRVADAAGVTARPEVLTDVRIDPQANRILFQRGGTEVAVDLPDPIRVGGLPFSQRDKVRYDAAAGRVERDLTGAALGDTYEAIPDRNRFSNALLAKLNGIRGWALQARPPLPTAGEVKALYETPANDRVGFTRDLERQLGEIIAQVGTSNLSDLMTESEATTLIQDTVGQSQALFAQAVVTGFFVERAGPATRTGQSYVQGIAQGGWNVPLVTGETIGLTVSDTTDPRPYDPVVVPAARITAVAEAGQAIIGGTRVRLARNGRPGDAMRYLLLARNAADALVVAFDHAGIYTVEAHIYETPTGTLTSTIDARIKTWARNANPTTGVPVDQLPDPFPAKWGKTHTDAQVDTRADARITAGVKPFALSGNATKVLSADVGNDLDENNIVADYKAPFAEQADEALAVPWTGVTGVPARINDTTLDYSVGRAITDIEGRSGTARLGFTALKNRTWDNLEEKPTISKDWDGTWTSPHRPFQDFPLTSGNAIASLLSDSGTATIPYRRIAGGPAADAIQAAQVMPWARAAGTPAELATAVRAALLTLSGNARLPASAVAGMLDVDVRDVGTNAQLTSAAAVADAGSGLFFVHVVGSAVTGWNADDFLIRTSGTPPAWTRVANLADTTIPPLTIDQTPRQATPSYEPTRNVRLNLGASSVIILHATQGRAGMMQASQVRTLRALSALPLAPPGTTLTGLDRDALVKDAFASGPIFNDFGETDTTKYLVVPAQTAATFTTYALTGVQVPSTINLVTFGRFNIGFDYLDGSATRILRDSRIARGIPVGELTAAFRANAGVPVLRTSGGATLWMGLSTNEADTQGRPEGMRFWETGRGTNQGHFRIIDLHAGLSAGDIVSALEWPNVLQSSIPDPSSTAKTPVRIATEAERSVGTTTAAVMTVKQVWDSIPDFSIDGQAVTGEVKRINFVTS